MLADRQERAAKARGAARAACAAMRGLVEDLVKSHPHLMACSTAATIMNNNSTHSSSLLQDSMDNTQGLLSLEDLEDGTGLLQACPGNALVSSLGDDYDIMLGPSPLAPMHGFDDLVMVGGPAGHADW